MGWKEKGRYVRKGERAILLCTPVTRKRKGNDDVRTDASDDGKPETFTRFVYRPNWFVRTKPVGDLKGQHPLVKTRAVATPTISHLVWRNAFSNARPEPVFRCFSNRTAVGVSAKCTVTRIRQGRCLEV